MTIYMMTSGVTPYSDFNIMKMLLLRRELRYLPMLQAPNQQVQEFHLPQAIPQSHLTAAH